MEFYGTERHGTAESHDHKTKHPKKTNVIWTVFETKMENVRKII